MGGRCHERYVIPFWALHCWAWVHVWRHGCVPLIFRERVYHDNLSCHGLLPMLWMAHATVNVPAPCSCEHDLNVLLWSGGLPGSHLFEKEMLDFSERRLVWIKVVPLLGADCLAHWWQGAMCRSVMIWNVKLNDSSVKPSVILLNILWERWWWERMRSLGLVSRLKSNTKCPNEPGKQKAET